MTPTSNSAKRTEQLLKQTRRHFPRFDDEQVEITPKAIRLRKRYLDPHERKRAQRQKEVA